MDIYNDVVYRLSQLGYTVPAGNTPDAAVNYAINRAAEKIKANINRTEIPDGLHYTWLPGFSFSIRKQPGSLMRALTLQPPPKRLPRVMYPLNLRAQMTAAPRRRQGLIS